MAFIVTILATLIALSSVIPNWDKLGISPWSIRNEYPVLDALAKSAEGTAVKWPTELPQVPHSGLSEPSE